MKLRNPGFLSILFLVAVLDAGAAAAQAPPQQPIPDWPAPAAWDLPSQAGTAGPGHVPSLDVMAAVQASSPVPFIALTPCRIADTRGNGFTGAYGPPSLSQAVPRDIPLASQCGIPFFAVAVSLNVTVTNTQGPGFIKIYPGGTPPVVSTLNYTGGETIANAAVVPLSSVGGITVLAGVSGTDLIIDTNGYYAVSGGSIFNTFLGFAGNPALTGAPVTAIGYHALASDTTGAPNTAIGFNSMANNVTGGGNVAVGGEALRDNITGNLNTAIGGVALISNQTGSGNIAVGNGACLNTTGNNNICIGNVGVAGQGGTIRIGSPGTHGDTFIAGIHGTSSSFGIGVLVNAQGQLGTDTSSRRFKEDIRDIGEESEGLLRLRPVAFRYKPEIDPSGVPQYGLIAEEVAEVYPDLVVTGSDGRPMTIRYQLINALLLNEVQKQRRTIDRQQAEIDELRASFAGLARTVSESKW